MAGKTIEMGTIKQVKTLSANGVAIKEISRKMGISRNTVRKYLRDDADNPEIIPGLPDSGINEDTGNKTVDIETGRFKAFEKLCPYIESELKKKGVTRQLLWLEYKEQYPGGYSYTQFCYHVQQYLKKNTVTLHLEQKAGDRLYVDYAGQKLEIVDRDTGEITQLEVFIATLGFSGLTYIEACYSQKKEDFLHCLENTLRYIGGVPAVIIPDNLKSAVQKANRYEAELNRNLEEFGEHHATGILPARSRKPRDKAWVERMVAILYTRVYAPLRREVFHDIESLNEALWDKLEEHNNMHLQGKPFSRRELFEKEEKYLLKPLHSERYEVKDYAQVTVMKNTHVQLRIDRHYYSVPYKYIGCKVKIIYTRRHVSIFYQHEQIAFHQRDPRPFKYTTLADHLPSTHRVILDWSPEKFMKQAALISASVENYIGQVLHKTYYPEQAYRSCMGIFNLGRKYGNDRLSNACERASYYGNYGYKIVENILKKNFDKLPLKYQQEQLSLPLHQNIRGADEYK